MEEDHEEAVQGLPITQQVTGGLALSGGEGGPPAGTVLEVQMVAELSERERLMRRWGQVTAPSMVDAVEYKDGYGKFCELQGSGFLGSPSNEYVACVKGKQQREEEQWRKKREEELTFGREEWEIERNRNEQGSRLATASSLAAYNSMLPVPVVGGGFLGRTSSHGRGHTDAAGGGW